MYCLPNGNQSTQKWRLFLDNESNREKNRWSLYMWRWIRWTNTTIAVVCRSVYIIQITNMYICVQFTETRIPYTLFIELWYNKWERATINWMFDFIWFKRLVDFPWRKCVFINVDYYWYQDAWDQLKEDRISNIRIYLCVQSK